MIQHSNDVIATGRMFYKPVLLGSQWFCCRCLRSTTLFFVSLLDPDLKAWSQYVTVKVNLGAWSAGYVLFVLLDETLCHLPGHGPRVIPFCCSFSDGLSSVQVSKPGGVACREQGEHGEGLVLQAMPNFEL